MSDLKPVQKLTYKILHEESTESLAVAVTWEMKLGWEPQGGVNWVPVGLDDGEFLQAMIKTESALS